MPVHAQSEEIPPLAVHGFMSQALARAWETPIAGLTRDATLDYRAVALQVAYRTTDADKLVLQFSHRRLGASALEAGGNDVQLDWGFYQHGIAHGALRIGRMPLPRGLFNEVRDVGTALPFYRAPLHVYSDAGETLEGITYGRRFFAASPWSIHTEVFGGAYDFDYVLNTPEGPSVASVEARLVHGGQLWLETPLQGTRMGIGGMRFRQEGATDDFHHTWLVSFESIVDRITLRAERMYATSAQYGFKAGYAQAGFRLIPDVTLNIQAEFADVTAYTPVGDMELDFGRDYVAGVTWMIRTNAALKLEGHRFRGYAVDEFTPFTGPPARGSYAIASIAVGF